MRLVAKYARAVFRAGLVCGVAVSVAIRLALVRAGLVDADRPGWIGGYLARRLDAIGGAYLKVGQVLSTRPDLFTQRQRAGLSRLCDRVSPPSKEQCSANIRASLGPDHVNDLVEIDAEPLAAGSITHVHFARRRGDGRPVAVKVVRTEARARFTADLALIRAAMRVGALIPLFRSVPMLDAGELISNSVGAHLDLAAEAKNHRRFADLYGNDDSVVVPRLHDDLCTADAMVMDFVEGSRIDDTTPAAVEGRRTAILAALRVLYAMLFRDGLVHCDLHPGNLLVSPAGSLILLDFGYVAELDKNQQDAFVELFLAMALNEPSRMAEVIVETGKVVPSSLDRGALIAHLSAPMDAAYASTAEGFNVSRFVASLFAIQRRHRIVASPGFMMGILALVTLEGLLKDLAPTIDFQREAMPFVMHRAGTIASR